MLALGAVAVVAVEEEGAEEVAGEIWGKAFALLLIPVVVEEEEEEEKGLGEAAEGGEVVAGVDDSGAAILTTAQAAMPTQPAWVRAPCLDLRPCVVCGCVGLGVSMFRTTQRLA